MTRDDLLLLIPERDRNWHEQGYTDRRMEVLDSVTDPVKLAAFAKVLRECQYLDGFKCCCSVCWTWYGVSPRCHCGNRRVYWAWDGERWRPEVY